MRALIVAATLFCTSALYGKSGEAIFQSQGCMGCHGANSAQGPRLENLYESFVTLQEGEVIKADEDYLRESILKPNKKIVRGFEPLMPSYKDLMNEEDLKSLVNYLKSIKVKDQSP